MALKCHLAQVFNPSLQTTTSEEMIDVRNAHTTTFAELAPSPPPSASAAGFINIAAMCRRVLIATDAEGPGSLGIEIPGMMDLIRQIGFGYLLLYDVFNVEPGVQGEDWFPFIRYAQFARSGMHWHRRRHRKVTL